MSIAALGSSWRNNSLRFYRKRSLSYSVVAFVLRDEVWLLRTPMQAGWMHHESLVAEATSQVMACRCSFLELSWFRLHKDPPQRTTGYYLSVWSPYCYNWASATHSLRLEETMPLENESHWLMATASFLPKQPSKWVRHRCHSKHYSHFYLRYQFLRLDGPLLCCLCWRQIGTAMAISPYFQPCSSLGHQDSSYGWTLASASV